MAGCRQSKDRPAQRSPVSIGLKLWKPSPRRRPVPNPDPGCVFCVRAYLQTRNSIVNQEKLVLSELANDKSWVFTYIYSPKPIVSATGTAGSPIAVK